MENWAPIPGYEGSYEVSDQGRVRSVERMVRFNPPGKSSYLRFFPSQLRSLHIDKAGYPRVTLKVGGARHNYLVHHLVLKAFVGPKPAGMECRHLNGNPADDRLENLKWGTPTENSYDTVRHGRHQGAIKTHCKNGHEFTPENTAPQTNGGRACRTCNKKRAKAFYEAHKGPRQPDNKTKTHCKRGHEFTPENTIKRKDGGRQCRTCGMASSKARYYANKQPA